MLLRSRNETCGVMTGKPSVLHVIAPGRTGGAERVVQLLAAGQHRAGQDVAVAAVLGAGERAEPFLAPLRAQGVGVHPLELAARRYDRERKAVAALCRELGVSVVHSHGYRADVVSASAGRALGIPTVTTVHGFTGGGWKNRFYERLQRRAFQRFAAVVSVSAPLAEDLARSGVPRERLHVIPNAFAPGTDVLEPLEARRELGVPPDRIHVGWVGRMSAEKGPDVALAAILQLGGLPVTLSMVGDGRQQRALELRSAGGGLADRVRWHGLLPEAGRLFRGFDIFLLSSRTEGTPIVLFEAMAAGVPIVATAVGGVPDVVSSAEAVLVRPRDPAALAEGIRAVVQDPDAAAARAVAARERLNRDFALEPWVDRHLELYTSLNSRAGAMAVQ